MAEANSRLSRTPEPTSLVLRPGRALSTAKTPHSAFQLALARREENFEIVLKFPKWLDMMGRCRNT